VRTAEKLSILTFCFLRVSGKLLSRSLKISFALLNRTNSAANSASSDQHLPLKSGDRVALVYPNADPLNFLCAFYGCLMAGIVPVPIEVPVTRRVSDKWCI